MKKTRMYEIGSVRLFEGENGRLEFREPYAAKSPVLVIMAMLKVFRYKRRYTSKSKINPEMVYIEGRDLCMEGRTLMWLCSTGNTDYASMSPRQLYSLIETNYFGDDIMAKFDELSPLLKIEKGFHYELEREDYETIIPSFKKYMDATVKSEGEYIFKLEDAKKMGIPSMRILWHFLTNIFEFEDFNGFELMGMEGCTVNGETVYKAKFS